MRAFVAFAYSHGLSDGTSGLAFHNTFLAGLQEDASTANTPKKVIGAMPAPFDTAETLPINT